MLPLDASSCPLGIHREELEDHVCEEYDINAFRTRTRRHFRSLMHAVSHHCVCTVVCFAKCVATGNRSVCTGGFTTFTHAAARASVSLELCAWCHTCLDAQYDSVPLCVWASGWRISALSSSVAGSFIVPLHVHTLIQQHMHTQPTEHNYHDLKIKQRFLSHRTC